MVFKSLIRGGNEKVNLTLLKMALVTLARWTVDGGRVALPSESQEAGEDQVLPGLGPGSLGTFGRLGRLATIFVVPRAPSAKWDDCKMA